MIRLHALTKRFHAAGGPVLAVDRLSLIVEAGEVYGLLGPNGAGKTTTLRMILGLLQPDEGYAEVDGIRADAHPMQVRSRIGMVAASDGVYPWLTVREMLMFFADLHHLRPQEARENVRQLSARLGFEDLLDRRTSTLSTGQKQRVILRVASCMTRPSCCWTNQREVWTSLAVKRCLITLACCGTREPQLFLAPIGSTKRSVCATDLAFCIAAAYSMRERWRKSSYGPSDRRWWMFSPT